MPEHTYNTSHSGIIVQADKLPRLLADLNRELGGMPEDNLADAFERLGFTADYDDDGDLVDLYLAGQSADPEDWETLGKCVGKYAEADSFLVFFHDTTCFALAFDPVASSHSSEVEVDVVVRSDLAELIAMAAKADPTFARRMHWKYVGGELPAASTQA
jgi:hypothetical protein